MVIRDVKDARQCGLQRQGHKKVAMSTGFLDVVKSVDAQQLASVIRNRIENVLIIDSRSFLEHNSCHISSSINVCCSKIVKRRLQQDKLSVKELLMHACHCDVDEKMDMVVYDHSSKDSSSVPADSFTAILLKKLQLTFRSVNLLAGGFEAFHQFYPDLCEDKTRKCPPLTSLSQPCLPIANQGPTRILPFLYLGSQFDALNKDLLRDHNITYELNVSTSCPQPEFVAEGHFMRIPVNDTYSEKLLPYFPEAFNFLDKVREGSGCVLVHCLAGISRSATVAIAYVMRYLHLSSDDGYRYVKSKRPTISPNFNFLGQLLEYEKQLRRENILEPKLEVTSAPPLCSKKRVCRTDMRTAKLSLDIDPQKYEFSNIFLQPRSGDQSPTTALAKLSFDGQKSTENSEEVNRSVAPDFRQYRSKSCYGDWLRDGDNLTERKSKECNITASKVLSPVKEIRCDALISEISTGGIDVSMKNASVVSLKQKMRSSYHGGSEKHNLFKQLESEKARTVKSFRTEERFSIQTLSHQTLVFRSKVQDSCAKGQGITTDMSSAYKSQDIKLKENRTTSMNLQSDSKKARICPFLVSGSTELPPKMERADFDFVFPKSPFQPEARTLHPFSFNVDPHNRSDSTATSGFGSESSDLADNNASEMSTKSDKLRLEIDFDDLEDDVIYKQRETSSRVLKHGASKQSCFPFPLPSAAFHDRSTSLKSPLSPSERHLLEDLDTEKDVKKTGNERKSINSIHTRERLRSD